MKATKIGIALFGIFLIVAAVWLITLVWVKIQTILAIAATFLLARKIAGWFGWRLSNLRKSRDFFRGS